MFLFDRFNACCKTTSTRSSRQASAHHREAKSAPASMKKTNAGPGMNTSTTPMAAEISTRPKQTMRAHADIPCRLIRLCSFLNGTPARSFFIFFRLMSTP